MARITIILLALILQTWTARAELGSLEQIDVDTFASLREVERYQLKVAEKLYLSGEFTIALDEYEKFLTLYEASAAAPYAQLMWSHCQVKLRKVNTAIREGFQSVIDYWPDSREAVFAAFLTARAYKDIGEVEKAEVAYWNVITRHPKDLLATLARVELLEMARLAKQEDNRLKLLRELALETPDSEKTHAHVVSATRELAQIQMGKGTLDEAIQTLERIYEGITLAQQIHDLSAGLIAHWCGTPETKDQGLALADAVIQILSQSIPAEISEGEARTIAVGLYYRIAAVYGQSGRGDDVYKTYGKMGTLFGMSDDLLGRMAEWHKGRNERDKAREIYAKFANEIAGLGLIAGMWREEGRYKEAIETYQLLIEKDKDRTSDYLWAIAECHEAGGNFEKAIQSYRLADRFPSGHFAMARCHRSLKEWNEAISLYGQAKADEGSAAEATLQIGYTWEQAGNKENAIKTFQQTCKLFPTSGQASQSHAHLQDTYKISVTLGGAKED